MKVKSFTFNPFQENTYIVYDSTKECIIIDPGCNTLNEQNILKQFITENDLNPVKLINTHCHIDHIFGNKFASEQWKVDLYMHKSDLNTLQNASKVAEIYGFENYKPSPLPKYFLDHDDMLNFGKSNFKVLFTPGHAPGHICLHSKENNILISGDLIFLKSIGRTDLPGGDYDTLINSIKKSILPLPNETQIFCGHGPPTTISFEKQHNPFLR